MHALSRAYWLFLVGGVQAGLAGVLNFKVSHDRQPALRQKAWVLEQPLPLDYCVRSPCHTLLTVLMMFR